MSSTGVIESLLVRSELMLEKWAGGAMIDRKMDRVCAFLSGVPSSSLMTCGSQRTTSACETTRTESGRELEGESERGKGEGRTLLHSGKMIG